MNDTIAAIATAGGTGSIAIVRLSGPDAIKIAKHVAPRCSFTPRFAELTPLFDRDNSLIDRAIVIYFKSPASFTGEDIVEFQCHGGEIVADEILVTLVAYGASLAEPGEFSKRAFLNGKIDLSEAEAIAKLIEAKSADAARILAAQLKGGLGDFVADIREKLLRALAHSEVMIDYAEEVSDDLRSTLEGQLSDVISLLERTAVSSRRRRGLIEGFRVAIVGKPNVGKSSLLNALLDYDRAIVSDIAGTTRDTIEEQIRIGSHIVRLIDTAGIRHSNDSIEQIGVERSLASIDEADVIVALFDNSRPFDDEDSRIVSLLEESGEKESIIVLNKIDLETRLDSSRLPDFGHLIKLSTKGDISPFIEMLGRVLGDMGKGDDVMLVSARQIEAVEACKSQVQEAVAPLKSGELEFFSYHIKEALAHIGSITHPYEQEDMLDRMFGEFCLGK